MSEQQTHNVAGESGFYHFYGVVEDRKDPLKAGRLRVRIFGKHSENVSEIPVEDLPWAQVMLPINAAPNEMCGLADGQLVFGFYADGIEQQVPIILGQIVVDGFAVNDPEGKKSIGFQDMREKKEVKRHDKTDFANGTNDSRNAQVIGPQAQLRVDQAKRISNKLFSFDEPGDTFAGKYPWIHSRETETGHIVEYDDTPGEERMYIWHRKGQYIELTKDGDMFVKTIRDRKSVTDNSSWDIILQDSNIHVGKNLNVFVGGNSNISVNGNANINVSGNLSTKVSGSYTINSGGTFSVKAPTIRLN